MLNEPRSPRLGPLDTNTSPSEIVLIKSNSESSKKKSNSRNSESQDDPNRKELLWDSKIEQQILTWRDEMSKASELHTIYGRRFKKLANIAAIPNVIVPLVLSTLHKTLKDQEIVVSLLLIASGIASGISLLFNFQKRSSKHHECANNFQKVVRDINLQMSKKKSMRIPADLMLQRVYHEYTSISDASPDVKSVSMKNRHLPITRPQE